jgi:hypothetical protein
VDEVAVDADSPYTKEYNNVDCDLHDVIDNWYADFTANYAASPLVTEAVTHNALLLLGTDDKHLLDGFSVPTTTPATPGAAGTAFPLSLDEVAEYLSLSWKDGDDATHYNLVGDNLSGEELQAYINFQQLTDVGPSEGSAWLRTPSLSTNQVCILDGEGNTLLSNVDTTHDVRIALWVHEDIFPVL